MESRSLKEVQYHQRISYATCFDDDKFKNVIVPSLYNLLIRRKSVAELLRDDLENEELIQYFNHINEEISYIIGV